MPETIAPTPVASDVLTDLSRLEAIHAREIRVEFEIEGAPQPVVIVGRRLKPGESGAVQRWLDEAAPKLVEPKTEEEFKQPARLDLEEPDYPGGYLARKLKCERTARALALWAAFVIFREAAAKEGVVPRTDAEISAFIEGRSLPDTLLQALFAALLKDEVRPALGFTSGSGFLSR